MRRSRKYKRQIYNKNLTPTNSPPLINKNKHSSIMHKAQFIIHNAQWIKTTLAHMQAPLPFRKAAEKVINRELRE